MNAHGLVCVGVGVGVAPRLWFMPACVCLCYVACGMCAAVLLCVLCPCSVSNILFYFPLILFYLFRALFRPPPKGRRIRKKKKTAKQQQRRQQSVINKKRNFMLH